MQFWQGFLVLSVLAAGFLLWPLVFSGRRAADEHAEETNEELDAICEQRIQDLMEARERGELTSEEFERLKKDLQKNRSLDSIDDTQIPLEYGAKSLGTKLPIFVAIVLVPLISLVLYKQLGAAGDMEIYDISQRNVESSSDARAKAQAMVAALQKRLKQDSDNLSNWYLLASTAMTIGDYDVAVNAYKRILDDSPQAARVMAELAQALFSQAGNKVTPEVRDYTNQALAIAPMIPTALGLAGVDAYQSGDYQGAIDYWQKATHQLDPSSASYRVLKAGIDRAKEAMGESSAGSETVATADNDEAKPSLTVEVSIGGGVDIDPTHSLFIYARAWQGPKMPLAIERITAGDLPVTVTLSKSMMPNMDLSTFPEVEVIARTSASGSVSPTPGDWQASFGPVVVKDQKESIKLTINKKIE